MAPRVNAAQQNRPTSSVPRLILIFATAVMILLQLQQHRPSIMHFLTADRLDVKDCLPTARSLDGSVHSSNSSGGHICDQLYSTGKRSNLFARVHIDLQPFKGRRIVADDIENMSRSCVGCHRVQIIDNIPYYVPRAGVFDYESRRLSVLLQIKQMLETARNIRDMDLFLHVADFVDLPDGLNDVRLHVPIFAFAKTNRTRRGVRSDALVLMPCFTFWNWPEARIGRWTDMLCSLANAAHQTPYKQRIAKVFWRGTSSWKRIRFIHMAHQHPRTMDVVEVQLSTNAGNAVHAPSSTYRTLEEHCKYKYLAYLEGNVYSSRLKYLLMCGSVVVYNAFEYWQEYWHDLLKDSDNIVVFEAQGNEAALQDKLHWLLSHESQAKEIGRRGQQLVREYLNEQAVTCYWWKLLHEYGLLLDYKPQLHDDAIAIDEFMR